MYVERRDDRLKITLSAVEICDYFGSFDDIRYDDAHTKSVLGELLQSAGFNLEGERLYIKVFPTVGGGCTIYFISSGKGVRSDNAYIYEFSCCEDMLSACERLLPFDTLYLTIFTDGRRYRIIFEHSTLRERERIILENFCTRVLKKRFEREKTREHWRCVCVNTPVRTVCGL